MITPDAKSYVRVWFILLKLFMSYTTALIISIFVYEFRCRLFVPISDSDFYCFNIASYDVLRRCDNQFATISHVQTIRWCDKLKITQKWSPWIGKCFRIIRWLRLHGHWRSINDPRRARDRSLRSIISIILKDVLWKFISGHRVLF